MSLFKSGFRRHFLTGLLVLLPLGLTFYFLVLLVRLADQILKILPPHFHPDTYLPFHLPGLGVIVTTALVFVVGFLTSNFVGRRLIKEWETLLGRIPLVRTIYGSTRQLVETIFTDSNKSFRQVVLVQFPRPGVYALGFVTGEGYDGVEGVIGEKLLHVFVPTTPNPTSGFLLFVPQREIIALDISVESGLKLVVSGGIIIPGATVSQPESAGSDARES